MLAPTLIPTCYLSYPLPVRIGLVKKRLGMSDQDSQFQCSVCLETASTDPVVTKCGHLFCWPCLDRWLHGPGSEERAPCCPTCKGALDPSRTGDIIPLYGRGRTSATSRASTSGSSGAAAPPRPRANREAPPPQPQGGQRQGWIGGGMPFIFLGFGFGSWTIVLPLLFAAWYFLPSDWLSSMSWKKRILLLFLLFILYVAMFGEGGWEQDQMGNWRYQYNVGSNRRHSQAGADYPQWDLNVGRSSDTRRR
jgi:hypothetical protein